MKAEVKHLHSPDAPDLRTFKPHDPKNFGILVQAMVGPEGDDSAEAFDVIVCTPTWLSERIENAGPTIGLHHVFVADFDHDALLAAMQSFCGRCEGANWSEVGAKVGRLGRWEFEEYRP